VIRPAHEVQLEQHKNEVLPGTLNLMVLKTLSTLGPLHGYGGKHMTWLRVLIQRLGVVRDSRYQSLREPDTRRVYLPMLQSLDQMGRLVLAVRGDGRAADLINATRNELRAAGPVALGASANRIVRSVMRETVLWVTLGAGLGLGAALATTRWLESLLFGLKPQHFASPYQLLTYCIQIP
jgi:hypothetical protein